MTTVILSSSSVAGTNIDLGLNEDLFITANVTRASTNGTAVLGDQGGHAIEILGSVFGDTAGVSMFDSADSSSNSRLAIGIGGSVTGRQIGVSSSDSITSISNSGYVSGNNGLYHTGGGFDFGLTNSGTIFGTFGNAVFVDAASGQIVNTGTIESTFLGYGIRLDNSAIVNSQTTEVWNYGLIGGKFGGIQGSFSDRNQINNYGEVRNGIFVGSQDDVIINAGLIDQDVSLGSGDDMFDGRGGVVTGAVEAGAGDDVVRGGDADDMFNGGSDNDFLRGGGGEDILDGGSGRDVVRGGKDADELDGGAGNEDWLDYRGSTARVVVNLGTGQADGGDAAGDFFTGFERLIGSSQNDTLTGNSGNNVLRGDNGNDFLRGASGDDLIAGGRGGDVLQGGNGVDALDYRTSAAGVAVNLSNNTASGGDAQGDTISGFERVFGSSSKDILYGNSADNLLNGGAGVDNLRGFLGNDILTGGTGADRFVFNTALNASTNVDTITDFAVNSDLIWLDDAIFTQVVQPGGTLLSGYFKANAAGVATDANDRIIYDTDSGQLYYDADGNGAGAAVQFALLSGSPTLSFSDFDVF